MTLFSAASSTHRGEKHDCNEDACVVMPEYGVFAVADGMGGHINGAEASALIADRLRTVAQDAAAVGLDPLKRCLESVNREIWMLAAGRRQVSGSTIAALLVRDDRYFCLWAGDSRIYHLREGRLSQLSHDHSEVQELVDQGVLNAESAMSWPRRNVVTRAVGARETIDLATISGLLERDDGFVLCSDGLTTFVSRDEIRDLVETHAPQRACDALVDLALSRGESDDVTVVVVRFRAKPAPVSQGHDR
jgi:protein phosphatase